MKYILLFILCFLLTFSVAQADIIIDGTGGNLWSGNITTDNVTSDFNYANHISLNSTNFLTTHRFEDSWSLSWSLGTAIGQNGWEEKYLTTEEVIVSNTQSKSNEQSLRVFDDETEISLNDRISFGEQTDNIVIYFWTYQVDYGTNDSKFYIEDNSGNNYYIAKMNYLNRYFQYGSNGTDYNSTIQYNYSQWYHNRLEINVSNQSYSWYYLDSSDIFSEICENVPYYDLSGTNPTYFMVTSYTAHCNDYYIDDLFVLNNFTSTGNITRNYTAVIGVGEELQKLKYNGSTPTVFLNVDIYASVDNSTYTLIQANASTNTNYDVSGNGYEYARWKLNTTNSGLTPEIYNISVEYGASGAAAPSITSYAPSTPNSSYENVDKAFNITIDQTVNVTWYYNGSLEQTNTSVTDATYTNTSAMNGTHNITAVATNVNGSDQQIWAWTVLLNSVDITYRELDYSNITANVLIDISNKTPGLQTIHLPHTGNLSSEYCLVYPNGTAVQACVACTGEGDTIWFNGSADRLPEATNYSVNETEAAVNTSTIVIPTNSWGMINNWTTATTFVAIAANVSNDVAYSYYNITIGEWESHYPPYSWNSDYVIPLEASVMMWVDAQTTVIASIVTPSNTSMYEGWNMVFVEGTSNRTISEIIIDMEASL